MVDPKEIDLPPASFRLSKRPALGRAVQVSETGHGRNVDRPPPRPGGVRDRGVGPPTLLVLVLGASPE